MRNNPGLPFSLGEFESRLQRVRDDMAVRGLDVAVVVVPENIYYLTGYTTTGYYMYQCLIVPAEEEPALVTYAEERINILRRSWVERCFTYSVVDDPVDLTVSALGELRLRKATIGLEEDGLFLPVAKYKRLTASQVGGRWVDCSGLVEQARLVKSPAEIACIRRAAGAAMEGMKAALAAVTVGTTENHIAAEVYRATLLAGSEYPGSPPYVATGERSGLPHGTWEGRVLRAGDIVFLEHSGCVRRYSAAMMRTAFLGVPPPVVVKTADIILEGLGAAIAAMRPGCTSGDVDAACRDTIRWAGFPDYTHETGYSIGICYPPGWNESHIMNLHPGDETVLRQDMVFHLVPSIIIPELQGHVGFSETVLVTETGAEVLTDEVVERKLHIIDAAQVGEFVA